VTKQFQLSLGLNVYHVSGANAYFSVCNQTVPLHFRNKQLARIALPMGGIKTVADLIPRKSDASAHLLALWRGVRRQPISELVSSRSQQVRASERAPAAYITVTQRDTSGYGPTGRLSGGKQ